MIKVSVLYPNSDGSKFDMDYYLNTHFPMVQEKLGVACKAVSVEQGLSGPFPGSQAAFVAMGHMTFDSVEAFQEAFMPHAETLMSDIPNFTDIQPVVQISSIRL